MAQADPPLLPQPPATNSRATRWCFTVNNWSPPDEVLIKAMDTVFLIYGKETGESGTPHLQGYCTFKQPQRLLAMKKRHPTAHWEVAKGNSAHNITYCSKDGDVFERGTRPADALRTAGKATGQANRQRFADALAAARKGDFDAIPPDLYARYRHTWHMESKEHMPMPKDLDHLPGIWIHGPAGHGKSRLARHLFPHAYKKLQNKWWDGYRSHPAVILDDFDFKDLSHHLKIWADRYAFTAEIKGGALNIRPDWFIITSNYSPDHFFNLDPLLLDAINRRFTVVHLASPWSPGNCVPLQLLPHVPRDPPQPLDEQEIVMVDDIPATVITQPADSLILHQDPDLPDVQLVSDVQPPEESISSILASRKRGRSSTPDSDPDSRPQQIRRFAFRAPSSDSD